MVGFDTGVHLRPFRRELKIDLICSTISTGATQQTGDSYNSILRHAVSVLSRVLLRM